MPQDKSELPWGEEQELEAKVEAKVEAQVLPKKKEKKVTKDITYHSPESLVIVGLDTEDGSENALYDFRVSLDENESLIRNIMVYGIQQPVICREEAGQLFVVDGRQRVRAARVAAKRQNEAGEFAVKVPVIAAKGDDSRVHGIMISANEVREDDSILGKALKASRMLDLVGDTAEVAIAFGRSEQTLRNWLSLAGADSAIHDAVRAGEMSAAAAIELSNLPREEQVEALGDKATTATEAKKHKAKKGKRKTQPGVKRMWAKKALKSRAFRSLNEDEKQVLEWIVTGKAAEGSWMEDFVSDVETEASGDVPAKEALDLPPEADSESDSSALPF
tara:strand:+ start:1315 stop:2313 length:999 start_codon:yes stop_codon:yes gene_type:complete